ncbi:MAG: hypothetical protein K6G32_07795 [Prevotella sp.]|nr:hypothetical protein [Prevotella sp.]
MALSIFAGQHPAVYHCKVVEVLRAIFHDGHRQGLCAAAPLWGDGNGCSLFYCDFFFVGLYNVGSINHSSVSC